MCSSSGNKYYKQRYTSIFSKLFKCKHRHVVFTIPDELRVYFRQDRKRFMKVLLDLIKYVCRYVSRPVMAESRIIDYDGTFVTFWYQRHNDDLIIIEKVHAYEFISRLIIHIPDYNFKQIRFYGAYHNSTKITIEVQKLISKEKSDYQKKLDMWRSMIVLNFEFDPINCPICNNTMIYYNSIYT